MNTFRNLCHRNTLWYKEMGFADDFAFLAYSPKRKLVDYWKFCVLKKNGYAERKA